MVKTVHELPQSCCGDNREGITFLLIALIPFFHYSIVSLKTNSLKIDSLQEVV